MIVMKVNYLIGNIELELFKNEVQKMINVLIKSGMLDKVLKEFSEEDLLSSVNGLFLSGDYIRLSNTKNGKLLRYLNFGGPNLKATNVLSRCAITFGGAL